MTPTSLMLAIELTYNPQIANNLADHIVPTTADLAEGHKTFKYSIVAAAISGMTLSGHVHKVDDWSLAEIREFQALFRDQDPDGIYASKQGVKNLMLRLERRASALIDHPEGWDVSNWFTAILSEGHGLELLAAATGFPLEGQYRLSGLTINSSSFRKISGKIDPYATISLVTLFDGAELPPNYIPETLVGDAILYTTLSTRTPEFVAFFDYLNKNIRCILD